MEKVYYETTTLCPECENFVPGKVVAKDKQIYITRQCPDHGEIEGLICSDQTWYEGLGRFDAEPLAPKNRKEKENGCPHDCGLCSSHIQIAGTGAIEISNHCNAKCPTCLADNQKSFEMTLEDVKKGVEALLKSQDRVEVLTLSGGEPTLHPRLFEILDYLQTQPIDRIVVNSNGIRISKDDEFLDRLAQYDGLYVCLHFDGKNSKQLRGISPSIQNSALDRLCTWKINVVPLILSTAHVNETELGGLVNFLLTKSKYVKSIILSMMCYTGSRGHDFPGDKKKRLTIAGTLDFIEDGSDGQIKKKDFIPLPMPNPLCAAIGYFFISGQKIIPLNHFLEIDDLIQIVQNKNFGTFDETLEEIFQDMINKIYAQKEQYENSDFVLQTFKEFLFRLFPEDGALEQKTRKKIAEETIKPVYLMQFMDSWTFDAKRLPKCSCQHLFPDGKIIPSCLYYTYGRKAYSGA